MHIWTCVDLRRRHAFQHGDYLLSSLIKQFALIATATSRKSQIRLIFENSMPDFQIKTLIVTQHVGIYYKFVSNRRNKKGDAIS